MKKPYSHFFFSITIIFFFTIFTTTMQLSSAQNLINSSCKAFAGNNPNIDYAFCATSLQAAPASRCATARGLGIISIRLIRYNVTDTRCFIKQLLKNTKWEDPYTKQCLGDCFDLYSDAIPAVKQAMKSFSAKRFDDANVQISSVMDASTTCEYCFGERSGGSGARGSPLTKRNDDVFEISAVALAVMRMLQTGSAGVID